MQMSGPGGARRAVVGVDGSPESGEAARVAAEEAAFRALELVVVHACVPASRRSLQDVAAAEAASRAAGQVLVDEVLAQVEVPPTITVRTVVEVGPVAALLTAVAADEALLVLGQHGLDPADGRWTGQVAPTVAGNVACPVVVVPAGWSRTLAGDARPASRPIVVGVGGKGSAALVLRVAYDEAELRRASLMIFHASTGNGLSAADRATTEHDVAEIVTDRHRDLPEVAVDYRFEPRATLAAWVEASSRARLLVLGRPQGPGGHRAWQYGLVRAMLQHARCPLLVVPSVLRPVLAIAPYPLRIALLVP